eukprot:14268668-Heterocapsa_arctica.AAC.1
MRSRINNYRALFEHAMFTWVPTSNKPNKSPTRAQQEPNKRPTRAQQEPNRQQQQQQHTCLGVFITMGGSTSSTPAFARFAHSTLSMPT